MSGARLPVGLCTLLVNHHGIPEPSALVLGACFPLKSPFRSMLLTLRGGPESLAPRAHRIPVYPIVSTFLYRAFTAHGPHLVGIHPRFSLSSLEAGFDADARFDDPRQLCQRGLRQLYLGHT